MILAEQQHALPFFIYFNNLTIQQYNYKNILLTSHFLLLTSNFLLIIYYFLLISP